MKLIIVIMGENDGKTVTDELNKNGYRVTRLFSYGGFLKTGNTTLLVGVRNSKVEAAIDIIKRCCKYERQLADCTSSYYPVEELISDYSYECSLNSCNNIQNIIPCRCDITGQGSAVLFVINIKRHEKVINLMEEILPINM